MPTYEYVCEACNHAWEVFQSMKDDALTECPTCGEPKAKRIVSGGQGFILKGGGWYADLYSSSKGSSKGEGSASASTSSDSSSSDTSSSSSASSSSDTSSSSSSTSSTSGSND